MHLYVSSWILTSRNARLGIIFLVILPLTFKFACANFKNKRTGKQFANISNYSNNQSCFSRWMENLPSALHRVPLTNIAIPGSHDSSSYSLKKVSPYSMGLDKKAKQIVSYMDIASAKDIIYRWSVTQSLSIKKQLENGVRYLDMRISYNHSDDEIYAVHGLTGENLNGILKQIKEFISTFSKEVVLVDFNHFYSRAEDRTLSTETLFAKVQRYLGEYLCPRKNISEVTLTSLWRRNKRVLLFLATSRSRLPSYVWRSTTWITSPFDMKTFQDPEKWIRFLTQNYDTARPKNKFYVTQGILQPHWMEILAGQTVNATLKTWISQTANPLMTKWLRKRKSGADGLNIIIADFIESFRFVPTVLSLNNHAQTILFVFRNIFVMLAVSVFWCLK